MFKASTDSGDAKVVDFETSIEFPNNFTSPFISNVLLLAIRNIFILIGVLLEVKMILVATNLLLEMERLPVVDISMLEEASEVFITVISLIVATSTFCMWTLLFDIKTALSLRDTVNVLD